jgi:hypothetical protein
MATIINADGTIKSVKNLGWLLRNWKLVKEFEIIEMEQGEGLMIAHLKDGRKYSTNWASFTLCKEWLHRPVFIGVPLQWGNEKTVC